MNNKLKSLAVAFSLAATLTGCAGRRVSMNEAPEHKPPTPSIQDVFNIAALPEAKPVPLNQVIDIFNELSDRLDIAFNYAEDGCYARAHLMSKGIINKGVIPQKIWAFKSDEKLEVQLPEQNLVQWGYHVASTIPTLMPNGDVQNLVIDPGLFNCPVSPKTWAETIKANPNNIEITPLGVSPRNPSFKPGDYMPGAFTNKAAHEDAIQTMGAYVSIQPPDPRKVFTSEFCANGVTQQQGRTWIAIHKPKNNT